MIGLEIFLQADQSSAAAAFQDARAKQRSALPDFYDDTCIVDGPLPAGRVPMSCADVVAQTRGKPAAKPNKFILPVDFASDRPQRGNKVDYRETPRPKGDKAQKTARADPNDSICYLCEGDGALVVRFIYFVP